MGTYLSTPVREKSSDDYTGKLKYGASSMQGWRISQEDAHNCQVDFDLDTDTSLFAVYDGHGGAEVAQYTAKNLPEFLKNLKSYKEGHLQKAVKEAFVEFDATLVEEGVIKQLKDIAGVEPADDNDDGEIDEEVKNEAALLREEATMPIEQLMERYKSKGAGSAHTKSNNSPLYQPKISSDPSVNEDSMKNDSEEKVIVDENMVNGSHDESEEAQEDSVIHGNDRKRHENREAVEDYAFPSETSIDHDLQPHCSKAKKENQEEEGDGEEESDDDEDSEVSDDSEEDKWNSDGNEESDDDEEEDDEISLAKLFHDEEEFEPMGLGDTPGSDSGCTAVVALLRCNELYVANAGDSRCVVCRGTTAVDMSFDHKPEDTIERDRIYKAGGKISADGRVNGGLNLSRAIGDHAYKRNNKLELKDQMITSLPDVKHVPLTEEDKFMVLACDGIWNVLSSQEVIDFVLKRIEDGGTKLSTICEELFDVCLAPDTSGDGTGCDNMTCIIVKFTNSDSKATLSLACENIDHDVDVKQEITASNGIKRRHSGDESGDDNVIAKRPREEIENVVS